MPLTRRQSARPGKQRHDVERFVADGCAMLGGDLTRTGARQIAIGGNRREIVVDMGHLTSPIHKNRLPDPRPVLSGVNVTIL